LTSSSTTNDNNPAEATSTFNTIWDTPNLNSIPAGALEARRINIPKVTIERSISSSAAKSHRMKLSAAR